MSLITNVILSFSICEDGRDHDPDDYSGIIAEVNTAIDGPGFVIPPDHTWYGGRKVLTRPTFIGCFNYLHLDRLLDKLRSMKWEEPGAVQLFVSGEEQNRWHMIPVFPDDPEWK